MKVEFPFSISRRQLSIQVFAPPGYGATSDCIALCKKVKKQGRYENAVHPFRLLSRFCRSQPLASRSSAPRASANDAFALVYALQQAPSPGCILRSALRRFLGRWYSRTSASLLALSTGALMFPALWQVILEYPSGSPPNSRLASPPAFALVAQSSRLCGRWFLTH